MSWYSALTLEQRQRREALREAKSLASRNGEAAPPDTVVRIAEYILRGEVPPPPERR